MDFLTVWIFEELLKIVIERNLLLSEKLVLALLRGCTTAEVADFIVQPLMLGRYHGAFLRQIDTFVERKGSAKS